MGWKKSVIGYGLLFPAAEKLTQNAAFSAASVSGIGSIVSGLHHSVTITNAHISLAFQTYYTGTI